MRKKIRLNRQAVLLACLALAVIFAPAAKQAMAYFTNYTPAGGSVSLDSFKVTTEVTEIVDNNKKTVTVRNTGDVPCYVRVRALAGEQFTLNFTPEGDGSWSERDSDGWWYYKDPIDPAASTDSLTVEILWDADEIQGDFNVVVLEECTPVRYEADGTLYADWDAEAKEVGAE